MVNDRQCDQRRHPRNGQDRADPMADGVDLRCCRARRRMGRGKIWEWAWKGNVDYSFINKASKISSNA